jgi:hypothetical protein
MKHGRRLGGNIRMNHNQQGDRCYCETIAPIDAGTMVENMGRSRLIDLVSRTRRVMN